jgi:carbonic anhydrase/acetyltransferase-like protein (isoleucine patch superfamily)
MKYSIGERHVDMHDSAWVAPNATVLGSVRLEAHSSVWFNAVIRGDNDLITIGERSNVQDGSVLHTDEKVQLTIGRDVTIGHMVLLHGCTIGDCTLVGIKATVLNHARIGRHCLIGAHSLITEGKEIPDRSLVMGVPGKVIRELTDEEVARVMANADHYVHKIPLYRDTLKQQS